MVLNTAGMKARCGFWQKKRSKLGRRGAASFVFLVLFEKFLIALRRTCGSIHCVMMGCA